MTTDPDAPDEDLHAGVARLLAGIDDDDTTLGPPVAAVLTAGHRAARRRFRRRLGVGAVTAVAGVVAMALLTGGLGAVTGDARPGAPAASSGPPYDPYVTYPAELRLGPPESARVHTAIDRTLRGVDRSVILKITPVATPREFRSPHREDPIVALAALVVQPRSVGLEGEVDAEWQDSIAEGAVEDRLIRSAHTQPSRLGSYITYLADDASEDSPVRDGGGGGTRTVQLHDLRYPAQAAGESDVEIERHLRARALRAGFAVTGITVWHPYGPAVAIRVTDPRAGVPAPPREGDRLRYTALFHRLFFGSASGRELYEGVQLKVENSAGDLVYVRDEAYRAGYSAGGFIESEGGPPR